MLHIVVLILKRLKCSRCLILKILKCSRHLILKKNVSSMSFLWNLRLFKIKHPLHLSLLKISTTICMHTLMNYNARINKAPGIIIPWKRNKPSYKMLSAILLPHLKRNFQLGQFYRCLNYDWDSSRNQVIPSSRISQGCARVYLLASIFYVIVKFIGILSSSVPLSDKIFHVALGWIYAASTVVGTELIANPAIVQLMNLIYQPQEHGGTSETRNMNL